MTEWRLILLFPPGECRWRTNKPHAAHRQRVYSAIQNFRRFQTLNRSSKLVLHLHACQLPIRAKKTPFQITLDFTGVNWPLFLYESSACVKVYFGRQTWYRGHPEDLNSKVSPQFFIPDIKRGALISYEPNMFLFVLILRLVYIHLMCSQQEVMQADIIPFLSSGIYLNC